MTARPSDSELRIQVFVEQRSGMTVGQPEIVIKATHVASGRVAFGYGERRDHANKAKAIAALEATLPKQENKK